MPIIIGTGNPGKARHKKSAKTAFQNILYYYRPASYMIPGLRLGLEL